MNLLKKTFTVGALDISGIYLDGDEARREVRDIYEYVVTVTTATPLRQQAVNKNMFMHPDYVADKDEFNKMFDARTIHVVYSTRNVADNVGENQVLAIMQCICDTPDLIIYRSYTGRHEPIVVEANDGNTPLITTLLYRDEKSVSPFAITMRFADGGEAQYKNDYMR